MALLLPALFVFLIVVFWVTLRRAVVRVLLIIVVILTSPVNTSPVTFAFLFDSVWLSALCFVSRFPVLAPATVILSAIVWLLDVMRSDRLNPSKTTVPLIVAFPEMSRSDLGAVLNSPM